MYRLQLCFFCEPENDARGVRDDCEYRHQRDRMNAAEYTYLHSSADLIVYVVQGMRSPTAVYDVSSSASGHRTSPSPEGRSSKENMFGHRF